MITKEIIVFGIVQGVGFRYFTLNCALKYNIKGYVKNLPNNTVKIIAQSEIDNYNKFIAEIIIGPKFSRVEKIEEKKIDNSIIYSNFNITY